VEISVQNYEKHPIPYGDEQALRKFTRDAEKNTLKGIAISVDASKTMALKNHFDQSPDETFFWKMRRISAGPLNIFRTPVGATVLGLPFVATGFFLGAGVLPVAATLAALPFGIGAFTAFLAVGFEDRVDFLREQSLLLIQKQVGLRLYQMESRRCIDSLHKILSEGIRHHRASLMSDEEERLFDVSFCDLCCDFPTLPVFSPHDHQKLHPFEYREICNHLDNVERKISLCEKSGDHAGAASLRENIDPFRGKPFSKDELCIDEQHLKDRIAVLERTLVVLRCRSVNAPDAVQQSAMEAIRDYAIHSYDNEKDVLMALLVAGNDLHMPAKFREGIQLQMEQKMWAEHAPHLLAERANV